MTRKGLLRAVYTAVAAVASLAAWQVATVPPPTAGVSQYECAGSNGSLLAVATTNVGGTTPVQFETSTDGNNWTTVTSNLPGIPAQAGGTTYGVAQLSGNGSFWLARLGNGKVYRSTDLASWSAVYTPAAGSGISYVYAGPTISIISGATSAMAPFYATSTDGITWTARTPPVYQTEGGGIRNVVTIGSTLYAAMRHGTYPYYTVIWSSSDGVTWTNEHVLPATSRGVLSGAAVGNVPVFGLSRQQVLAKVDGTWQIMTTGPDDLLERRQGATKALPTFVDGLTDLPPTLVVGVGSVGKEIVTAQQPAIGMWSSNWPQIARFYDGSVWTDLSDLWHKAGSLTITNGTQYSGTYIFTHAEDGSSHALKDAVGKLDCYYEYDVASDLPALVSLNGRIGGANDPVGLYGWNWSTSAWVLLSTISNTTALRFNYPLAPAMVGTGDNAGKVRLRLYATGLTTSTTYIDLLVLRSGIDVFGPSSMIDGDRSLPLPLPADGDDMLYLGNREGLQRLGWELSTAGSYTGLRLEYSTATGWRQLPMADGSKGLTVSGAMTWHEPKDWAQVALPGQPASMRTLRWVRLRCDGCTVRAVGAMEGYRNQEQMLYRGGLYRVGGKELQPWNLSMEIDCLLPLGQRLFAVCYDPEGQFQPVVMEVR